MGQPFQKAVNLVLPFSLCKRALKQKCRITAPLRRSISLILSASLLTATPFPLFASSTLVPANNPSPEIKLTPEIRQQMRDDNQLVYWSTLEEKDPRVAAFALDGESATTPLWKVDASNSLVDQDPYFMRSQTWVAADSGCAQDTCVAKVADGVEIQFPGASKKIRLNQALSKIMDTDAYVIFSADNLDIFKAKLGENTNEPGEGFFFIVKADVAKALSYNAPVPVFYIPLPGSGWTGPNAAAFEYQPTEEYVFPDRDGDPLRLDKVDFQAMEKISRQNLHLAQSWSALEGQINSRGVALPKIGTTMLFGLQLTGQLPNIPQKFSVRLQNGASEFVAGAFGTVLPQATAKEPARSLRQVLAGMLKRRARDLDGPAITPTVPAESAAPERSLFRRWLAPAVVYGGTFALAAAANQHINWTDLITADMPARLTRVAEIFGGVALISYVLKHSAYKEKLAKLYPKGEASDRVQAAKGFLTIFAQGMWVSLAGLSMMIRQILDFAKDRIAPKNKTVHRAWEYTMGFMLKSSSNITINWKAALLGWTFGIADATMVFVDLVIFTPLIMNYFGMTDVGAATVTYASAAVLSQFVGYAQTGPRGYAADVTQIHFQSAENEAKRKMETTTDLDPSNPRNEGELQKLTAVALEMRMKAMGLPSRQEFFFDPLSIWQLMLRKLGYSSEPLQNLTQEDRDALKTQNFILSSRNQGLIGPTLKAALADAIQLQARSPSENGEKTVAMLRWAISNRGLTVPIAGRVFDTLTSRAGFSGLRNSVAQSVDEWAKSFQVPAPAAASLTPQAQVELPPDIPPSLDGIATESAAASETAHSASTIAEIETEVEKKPTWLGKYMAVSRGVFRYLAADSTQREREVRAVTWLMSTSNSKNVQENLTYLPPSWIAQAGSQEAAELAAELIHSNFIGYIEKDRQSASELQALEGQFGSLADEVMSRVTTKNPDFFADPFARAVKRNLILKTLKEEAGKRAKIESWQPQSSWLARRQWRIARDAAEEAYGSVQNVVTEEWLAVAKNYADPQDTAFVAEPWIREQRYRFLVAQKMAQRYGLAVQNVEDSEFVQKVMVKASQITDDTLSGGKLVYLNKLNPAEQKFFAAQVFTEAFIDTYVGMSVHTDVFLKASSPEFPGRLQSLRRKIVGWPGESFLRTMIKNFEMFGRNEETSYKPGFWSMLDRSLPVIPDFYHNLKRTLRVLPYAIGPAYLTQRYIFQINYPYVMWVATVLLGFSNGAFVEMNNRWQRIMDKKPMGGFPEKLLFARMHSLMTNPQAVLELMFAEPIVRSADHAKAALIERCEAILTNKRSVSP